MKLFTRNGWRDITLQRTGEEVAMNQASDKKSGKVIARFRAGLFHYAAVLICLASLLACTTGTPSIRQIREKIIDAYGGRARLSQIRSVAAEGSITAIVRQDRGTYHRAWVRDGRLFVDVTYNRSRETRILNGRRALRGMDGKLEEATGPGAQAMIYQYNELSMPFALVGDSFQIRAEGREPVDGAETRVLHCTDRQGNSIDLFVDEATDRIVKTSGSFTVNGTQTTLSSVYSDFRPVEGVLLPFRITNYAGTIRISETVINSYLLNGPLNDALFEPRARIEKH